MVFNIVRGVPSCPAHTTVRFARDNATTRCRCYVHVLLRVCAGPFYGHNGAGCTAGSGEKWRRRSPARSLVFSHVSVHTRVYRDRGFLCLHARVPDTRHRRIAYIRVQRIPLNVDSLGPKQFARVKPLAIQSELGSKTPAFLTSKSFRFARVSHNAGKKICKN